MWLTDLDRAVASSGLPYRLEPGWPTRGRGDMAAVDGLGCHHTVDPPTGDYPSLKVVRDGRGVKGNPNYLPGPLSHLGFARSGTVIVIAAGLCNHAGVPDAPWPGLTGNSDMIGIEAASTGVKRPDGSWDWTQAQKDGWPRLVHALAAWYRFPVSNIVAHREWAPSRKIDPAGIDMGALRAWKGPAVTMPITPAFEPDVRGRLRLDQIRDEVFDRDVRGTLAAMVSDDRIDDAAAQKLDRDLRAAFDVALKAAAEDAVRDAALGTQVAQLQQIVDGARAEIRSIALKVGAATSAPGSTTEKD